MQMLYTMSIIKSLKLTPREITSPGLFDIIMQRCNQIQSRKVQSREVQSREVQTDDFYDVQPKTCVDVLDLTNKLREAEEYIVELENEYCTAMDNLLAARMQIKAFSSIN